MGGERSDSAGWDHLNRAAYERVDEGALADAGSADHANGRRRIDGCGSSHELIKTRSKLLVASAIQFAEDGGDLGRVPFLDPPYVFRRRPLF